jgi:hypothetical protein
MDREELRRILDQVTGEILDEMRLDGFYYQGRKRYDPQVWDINNGYCDSWALRAAELIPGAFTAWIDPDVDHCVLVYDGKFYDADCPDGVDKWSELPMFADPQQDRPDQ